MTCFTVSEKKEELVNVPRYGRWSKKYSLNLHVDHLIIICPNNTKERVLSFLSKPAKLQYNSYGYETVVTTEDLYNEIRYTPVMIGCYKYQSMSGEVIVEVGEFYCHNSAYPGYVEVSKEDPRYFAFTNGGSFCPIGINLCNPLRYELPKGNGHFEFSGDYATMGCKDYERWFSELSENGANFTRIWLSSFYFEVEGDIAGEIDISAFVKLDTIIELARKNGIFLKLCFEHFRTFEKHPYFSRTLKHPETGESPTSVSEWFQSDRWRACWLKKVNAYLARYSNEPTIMVWELWNEINCCETENFKIQRDWTRDMIQIIKSYAPRQLVVNSLGSLDCEEIMPCYDDFKGMNELDFQQIHRYLDEGAPLEICRKDPVAFSVDFIKRMANPQKPILLAETGAVNSCHTGVFRFCRRDHRGIVFQDTTFPAFFLGAAGVGQNWFWDSYVEQKNLIKDFRSFSNLIKDVQLDKEHFNYFERSTSKSWFFGLEGDKHILAWVRNKQDNWKKVLMDNIEPEQICDEFDLSELGFELGNMQVFGFNEQPADVTFKDGNIRVAAYRYGFMLRISF